MDHEQQNEDIRAIRRVVADADRFQSDPERFTRLLTPDVVLVNFGGRRVRGRDNLYEAMDQALQTPYADVLTKNELEQVDFLRPDVAVASCVKHISDERAASSTEPHELLPDKGALSFVLVKEQGEWLIAVAQTTPIRV